MTIKNSRSIVNFFTQFRVAVTFDIQNPSKIHELSHEQLKIWIVKQFNYVIQSKNKRVYWSKEMFIKNVGNAAKGELNCIFSYGNLQ